MSSQAVERSGSAVTAGEDGLRAELRGLLAPYRGDKSALIMALQAVHGRLGYLPPVAVAEIARTLNVTESQIYGVATFYAQFRFTRSGEHYIQVCLGTACHVKGGERVLEGVSDELGIEPGGTTEDFKFSLERVACFGSCALAPVMVVDRTKVYGRMSPAKARQILGEVGK